MQQGGYMLQQLLHNEIKRAIAYLKGAETNIITPLEFSESLLDKQEYKLYKYIQKKLKSIVNNLVELQELILDNDNNLTEM